MTLVVRAIVRAGDAGRHDGFVAVRGGDVAALATRAESQPAPDETAMREHHALAARIHESGASLPSRFGQVFADESALANAIAERNDELSAALEAVGERVEISVTLVWRTPPETARPAAPRSGREFLVARAVRERVRRDAEEAVTRLVAALANERAIARHDICPREGVAAIVALLIERQDVHELRERAEAFARSDERVSATVHGPMPPYSFTS